MKSYTLSELLTIKNGRSHHHLNQGTIPVYGSGGLMTCVDEYLYDGPSILLPRKGSLSNIQFADGKFWTVDTLYYTIVNTELADPYYLFCYLSKLDLSRLDSGTGVPSMTFDSYYQIEVSLPDIAEQRKTAQLLYSYDRAIRHNRQINDNLATQRTPARLSAMEGACLVGYKDSLSRQHYLS